jgi:hypothetical protein
MVNENKTNNHIKRPLHMALEIYVLAWDRQRMCRGYTVCTIKSCIESGSSRNNMVIKCYNQNLM